LTGLWIDIGVSSFKVTGADRHTATRGGVGLCGHPVRFVRP